ncbi:methionyl-tRNA synthetase-like protein [Amniculicola lignicola CBS 123094]|uniref:Probable methionine--tRNA ligase, mitochondrial n=1 Tax=Amniculicola lignicola CBS 123094 TaxID=1392246 RepID=A0A6A5WFY6_9PLEO|nr:methionyl-tRNA synthetase-like protein [Amniculicola lignicola CBS 123094]
MRTRLIISGGHIVSKSLPFVNRVLPLGCRGCQIRSHLKRHFSFQSSPEKPYYITTPIFYVNAAPHVGHLFTIVITDILKRWQELQGKKALFLTGTDEHGLKVQRAAAKAGVDPKSFCDKGAAIFKELAKKAEISNDYFIRTTDKDHSDAVQYAWFMLQEKGLIYASKHEGWYSVTDEAFYPRSGVQLYLDPPTGRKMMTSIETGGEVEWSSELNYHFRLSAFREPLLQFYKDNPTWISPEHRMNDVVQAVKGGLEDLSVSRPTERLSWGIRVPGDETQTIYVWLDALLNYTTKVGYPWQPGDEHLGGWPADCHVIGKDIVRFHCIYWPAFLMALGLPLPKKILSHGHWTLGGSKMSKSTGKVVDPFHAIDRFGPDVMRFFLAYDAALPGDSSYDNARIITRYNDILYGKLGNLVSRVTRSQRWNVRGAVQRVGNLPAEEWADSRFYNNSLDSVAAKVEAAFEECDPRKALHIIVDLVRGTNTFLQDSKPWEKALSYASGEPGDEVDRIVYLAAESLRMSGIMLQPYMPKKATILLDQLGVEPSRRTFQYCRPGVDLEYGVPMVDLGKGKQGVLFPPLASNE